MLAGRPVVVGRRAGEGRGEGAGRPLAAGLAVRGDRVPPAGAGVGPARVGRGGGRGLLPRRGRQAAAGARLGGARRPVLGELRLVRGPYRRPDPASGGAGGPPGGEVGPRRDAQVRPGGGVRIPPAEAGDLVALRGRGGRGRLAGLPGVEGGRAGLGARFLGPRAGAGRREGVRDGEGRAPAILEDGRARPVLRRRAAAAARLPRAGEGRRPGRAPRPVGREPRPVRRPRRRLRPRPVPLRRQPGRHEGPRPRGDRPVRSPRRGAQESRYLYIF